MHEVRQRPPGMGPPPICFNPDGTGDFYAAPCVSEEDSHCCSRSGGICLSNGYCMDFLRPFAIWRGSCTDPTWESAKRPKACIGGKYLSTKVRLSIWDANSTSAQYCCGDADTTQTNSSLACIDGSPTFTLSDGTPLLGVAGLSNAQQISSSNSTSDTSDHSVPTTIDTADQNDCSAQRHDTITVGSVLGVSLLAVAIALVLWPVWERRQKVLWWQRAIGLAPSWPPALENAPWLRAQSQTLKPPPCPITRAKFAYAAHQQHKCAQEQPAATCGTHGRGSEPTSETQIPSPQRPREMSDGIPAAAEMDAT